MNNIAFLIPSMTMGGAEKLTLTIINKLSESKDILIYLILLEKEIDLNINNKRVQVIKLSEISTYSRVLKFIAIPYYVNKLSTIISKYEITSVYSVMERANFINFFTSKLKSNYSPILSVHSAPSLAFKKRSVIKQKFIRYLYSNTTANTRIIAVSNGIKKELEELYHIQNIKVIYNPVNIEEVKSKASLKIENNSINNNKFNIIAVGRFVEAKGFIYLIQAFAKIDRNIRDKMNLILVGDGVDRPILEAIVLELAIKNDVKFVGYQDNPYKYMKQSDLFILSSLWEGFGIVLIEAMALGIPIVSSNCKYGPSEILLDENKIEYGMLVDLVDDKKKYINNLHDAIIELYNNPKLGEKYTKLSSERITNFHIENIVKNYMDLFKKSEKNE